MKLGYKLIILLITTITALGIISCDKTPTANTTTAEKKELIMGISPGPYSVLFVEGVEPILKKQGYSFKHVNFSSLLEANTGVNEGSVDFNVDQHTAFLNVYNKQRNANLSALIHIPTVPTAIFSKKHQSIDKIGANFKIAIPQDPSNAARAYRLLAKANWIKLKNNIDKKLVSKQDVEVNNNNLELIEMDSSNIPRILDDVDYAVIPGSLVYSSKIDRKYSLLAEDVIDDFELVVAIREDDKQTQWAKDIADAYQSEEFKQYLQEHNKDNFWFIPAKLFK